MIQSSWHYAEVEVIAGMMHGRGGVCTLHQDEAKINMTVFQYAHVYASMLA